MTKILFGLGFGLFLVSLPGAILAFVLNCYSLFVASTCVGILGLAFAVVAIILKLASLFFRLK